MGVFKDSLFAILDNALRGVHAGLGGGGAELLYWNRTVGRTNQPGG